MTIPIRVTHVGDPAIERCQRIAIWNVEVLIVQACDDVRRRHQYLPRTNMNGKGSADQGGRFMVAATSVEWHCRRNRQRPQFFWE
jgi:hypothetical protein